MQPRQSPPPSPASVPAPPTPLKEIALTVSGGGFRAAAFGLGCLSYLNRNTLTADDGRNVSLLERTSFMASASGGSFAVLHFAKCLYEDPDKDVARAFDRTYRELRAFMDGETMLKTAMRILEDDRQWKNPAHQKQRNLVNAFSLAYDELLFRGTTLGQFCNADEVRSLQQFCANSTELKNGMSFRFQNIDGEARTGLVGNFGLYLRKNHLDAIRQLKLADIMTASSCFPAGLEPLMFPDDFAHTDVTTDELRKALYDRDAIREIARLEAGKDKPAYSDTALIAEAEKTEKDAPSDDDVPATTSEELSFGLMDGGINDNQAVASLMLADDRRRKGHGFDTFMVCDVSGRYTDQFAFPTVKAGFFSRLSVGLLATGLAVVLVALGIVSVKLLGSAGLAGGFTSLLVLEAGLVVWLWRRINSAGGGTWGRVWRSYKGYFFTIPLGTLLQMLEARVDSVVLLAGDVMMKQIRRLIFDQFFDNKAWDKRRVAVFLYALTTRNLPLTNVRAQQTTGHPGPQPSKKLQAVADEVIKMDTTLWFNGSDHDNHLRDKLVATGQFTMCYSLLRYIDEIKSIPISYRLALDDLQVAIENDWGRFNEQPLWLVHELDKKAPKPISSGA